MKRKEKEFDYLDDDYVQVCNQLIGVSEPFKIGGATESLKIDGAQEQIIFQLYLTQNITIGDIVYTAADPSAK